ncbi:alpha/beta hydrolase [Rhizobium vallis]|uniref:Alpha/beta hydrolase n=1 Tax=Rhizobium vallis TaxID=634290 RepID=A0A432PJR9_9HYPH|nr:alpha/beta hydrolase [Rhizobium vallis]RUM24569.1 alpha/beta hydrolase [Rhizobium vallis]
MKLAEVATASGSRGCWIGGQGSPLLLIHGGWAGAEAHWNQVWLHLAKQHTVIAIELPGIWREFEKSLASYRDYAGACADLLTALELTDVTVLGNSLGASVGWQLALNRPDLVRRLIMVNGLPPSQLPMRKVLGLWPFRSLALRSLVANFYGPAVFKTAFFSPANIPEAVRVNLSESGSEMAKIMFRLLYSVTTTSGRPSSKIDFVWGEQDGLPNMKIADGRKFCSAHPGARMFSVPKAGHLPQVENPRAFAAVIGRALTDNVEGAEPAPLEDAHRPA